jgi:hypothetical protein
VERREVRAHIRTVRSQATSLGSSRGRTRRSLRRNIYCLANLLAFPGCYYHYLDCRSLSTDASNPGACAASSRALWRITVHQVEIFFPPRPTHCDTPSESPSSFCPPLISQHLVSSAHGFIIHDKAFLSKTTGSGRTLRVLQG